MKEETATESCKNASLELKKTNPKSIEKVTKIALKAAKMIIKQNKDSVNNDIKSRIIPVPKNGWCVTANTNFRWFISISYINGLY